MTGKHLPPDTGRELSRLKARVTDLERMLDRIRRPPPAAVTDSYNTPFAALGRNMLTTVDPDTFTVLAPTDGPVLDPTGHIFVDHAEAGHGWFVIKIPGFYELGGTVAFLDPTDGRRRVAVTATNADGDWAATHDLLVVDRAPAAATVLSASRILHVATDVVLRWHLAVEHGAETPMDVQCQSFWTRFVTTGTPPPAPGS